MNIDQKLIEKYHLGQCSPTERLLVEQWLLDDTFETKPLPISTAQKNKLESDIWADINAHIEQSNAPIKITQQKYNFRYLGIAASLLAVLSIGFHLFNISEKTDATFDNRTNASLKYINQDNYKIVLGKNATAQINTDTGEIKTTGNMLFIPKKNFAFSLSGDKKKELKTGETYFVLQPQKNGNQVIIAKSELTFLAPTLQHELKLQFNII
ncbi:hypothetical protein [Sphingobacterium siyangense]|jgi:hypothetical protein|uniref:hypothetical protein n=1 Tax=Sphingobacterium siyangense TaxID=459529 RepID=UPI0028AA48D3|nr:hypothetical protein [Sphingobacterium siyangense]